MGGHDVGVDLGIFLRTVTHENERKRRISGEDLANDAGLVGRVPKDRWAEISIPQLET